MPSRATAMVGMTVYSSALWHEPLSGSPGLLGVWLLLALCLLLLAFRLGFQLLAEEVVQEGADHRDDGEADQLLLARRDRGGQDVGGELELQRQR